jgi:hypothetical protein
LAKIPGWSLERLVGRAASEKLTALAWNRDPREIKTHRRAQSAGAQSALGKKPAEERVFRPTLRHLADRIGTRLRAKSRPGRTVTVRVRFADLHAVTRSLTLDAPISATAILAEIAEQLVRTILADHPDEKFISLLAISVSQLEKYWDAQLELPLGLENEERRPGTKRGMRVGWPTAPLTGFAIDSDGRPSDTDRSLWDFLAPFPTHSANSPRRIWDSNPYFRRERSRFIKDAIVRRDVDGVSAQRISTEMKIFRSAAGRNSEGYSRHPHLGSGRVTT